MKNMAPRSGGKYKLASGDSQMPTHNSRKNLNQRGDHTATEPSGAAERGYSDHEKLGGGSGNFGVKK